MASINISLPAPLLRFLKEQVKKHGYSTVSEYVRDLLRAAKRQPAQDHIDNLLLAGLESGPATEMTASDWDDIRKELETSIAKNPKKNS